MTPTNNALPELLPCPFCGEYAAMDGYIAWNGVEMFTPQCAICHAKIGDFDDHAEAVSAWNRRAEPSSNPLQFGRASAGREAVACYAIASDLAAVRAVPALSRTMMTIRCSADPVADRKVPLYFHPAAPELPKQGEGGSAEDGVEVLATGWFHALPADDPANGTGVDDYEFHDITNLPTQPCEKCIPAYIVRRALAKKAEGA